MRHRPSCLGCKEKLQNTADRSQSDWGAGDETPGAENGHALDKGRFPGEQEQKQARWLPQSCSQSRARVEPTLTGGQKAEDHRQRGESCYTLP